MKMKIIEEAMARGQKALSEYESKKILASYGISVTREELVSTPEEAVKIAKNLGFPVVLKGCAPDLTHKTEMNVIRLNLENEKEVIEAFQELASNPAIPKGGIMVQEMIKGQRELVIGMNRDPQFGPCVMFGLGGIFTEILRDVSFRVAPLEKRDALEMMAEIRASKILEPFRGSPAVDREILAKALIAVGQIGLDYDNVREIDINPVIISGDKPVAVDALVVLNN